MNMGYSGQLAGARMTMGSTVRISHREDLPYATARQSVVRTRTLSPSRAPQPSSRGLVGPHAGLLGMGMALGPSPLASSPLASSPLAASPLASSPPGGALAASPTLSCARLVGGSAMRPVLSVSASQHGLAAHGSPTLEHWALRPQQTAVSQASAPQAPAPRRCSVAGATTVLLGASPQGHVAASPPSRHRCIPSPALVQGFAACSLQAGPQPALQSAWPHERQQRRSFVAASPIPAAQDMRLSFVPGPQEDVISAVDMRPWLRAAAKFQLNDDFDISGATLAERQLDLAGIMAVMKRESAGKRTIQALADKLTLHRMLENLSVPQLPCLLAIEGKASWDEVAHFVDTHLTQDGCADVVVKPTHLSNGSGVLVLSQVRPEEREQTVSYLVNHMDQFMARQAGQHESLALQSLKPGFMIQPRYQSVVGFKTPMELRVIALWGKVRLGLWWWGRTAGAPGEAPQRNLWMVRRPANPGQLSDEDTWEAIHEHPGGNPGFDCAVALFTRHMSAMAATTEAVATAVGAPFLRADFFVGSTKWGCRLNEVAYGCGCDYRYRPEGGSDLVDDAPVMAKILSDGLAVCSNVYEAKHFLARVGTEGETYEELAVTPLPQEAIPPLPARALRGSSDEAAEELAMPEDLCKTTCISVSATHAGARRSTGMSAATLFTPRCSPAGVGDRSCRRGSTVEVGPSMLPAGAWVAAAPALSQAPSKAPMYVPGGKQTTILTSSLEAPPGVLMTPRSRPGAEAIGKMSLPTFEDCGASQRGLALFASTPSVVRY